MTCFLILFGLSLKSGSFIITRIPMPNAVACYQRQADAVRRVKLEIGLRDYRKTRISSRCDCKVRPLMRPLK